MIIPLLLTLPWIGLGLFLRFGIRLAPELPADDRPTGGSARPDDAPLVSVVIPARNEAHNIRRVLESVTASRYPAFEVVVVDDRSDDGTAELAREVDVGSARRLVVVDGEPLPAGWLGKPWACWQGSRKARGELLLFTDADTVHGPDLLGRAVRELDRSGADVLTLAGRQLMESFWERLIQPQIFLAMIFRYPDLSRPFSPERWRSAIANGQYILFRREVYEDMGGHERVKDAVVEDMRLAQVLVKEGRHLAVRLAEGSFATRMYRSLGEIVSGWSKNLMLGGLQTLPPKLRRVTAPFMLLVGAFLWLVPPAVLGAAVVARASGVWAAGAGVWVTGAGVLTWAVVVVGVSALIWIGVSHRFGAPWYYGLLYPVGAAVGWYIVLGSWLGMRDVEWKGRRYRATVPTD